MSEYIIHYKDAETLYEYTDFPFLLEEYLREPIVRCRDCKHFTPKGTHKFENGKTNADCCMYVRGWLLQITPDGYCKWGERRKG